MKGQFYRNPDFFKAFQILAESHSALWDYGPSSNLTRAFEAKSQIDEAFLVKKNIWLKKKECMVESQLAESQLTEFQKAE